MNRLRICRLVAPALALSISSLSLGCSHGSQRPASTPPVTPAAAAAPHVHAHTRNASATIEAFEKKHPLSDPDEPLRHPTKLEDVDTILHLDQMDLFEGAEAFAAKQTGGDAAALCAQIEIAHSEAQIMVADVLGDGVTKLLGITRTLRFRAASGSTSERERAKLAELESALSEAHEVEWALREQAAEHARHGAEMAHRLMSAPQGSYRGYRVAADYHRLRRDWPAFEEALGVLSKANPSSNGLVFLRALNAQADGNLPMAAKLLQTALDRDPKFVRAEAHLMMIQPSPDRSYAELTKLKAMNPHHQLVAYAGPFIEAAYEEWQAQRNSSRPAGTTNL